MLRFPGPPAWRPDALAKDLSLEEQVGQMCLVRGEVPGRLAHLVGGVLGGGPVPPPGRRGVPLLVEGDGLTILPEPDEGRVRRTTGIRAVAGFDGTRPLGYYRCLVAGAQLFIAAAPAALERERIWTVRQAHGFWLPLLGDATGQAVAALRAGCDGFITADPEADFARVLAAFKAGDLPDWLPLRTAKLMLFIKVRNRNLQIASAAEV